MAKGKIRTTLSTEQIQIAVEAGIEAYKKEMWREKKRREQDEDPVEVTRKLLKNYRTLKDSLSDEVFTLDEIQELRFSFFQDLMENHNTKEEITEMRIRAKQNRKILDVLQIAEIDEAFEKYKNAAEKKGPEEERKCRVLYALYMAENESKAEDIAASENIAERTVYNDAKAACQIFSIYLFGSLTLPSLLRK